MLFRKKNDPHMIEPQAMPKEVVPLPRNGRFRGSSLRRGHQPAVHPAGILAGASVNQTGSRFAYDGTLKTTSLTLQVA